MVKCFLRILHFCFRAEEPALLGSPWIFFCLLCKRAFVKLRSTHFITGRMSFCWPTNSIGALKETQTSHHHHHHNRFMAVFPGPPGWSGTRRELLEFMVQGKINRGRHTDHPAGRHSARTNQCPPPPSPHFLQVGCPSCRPTNSVKALNATSAFGLGSRR